jgi:hypothetical protein
MSEIRIGEPTEVSVQFLQGMADRMAVSFHKYGPIVKAYPDDVDAIASLKKRLERYEEDGNTEWLQDVANFAMIEFMLPRHPQAHFDAEARSIGRMRTDGRAAGETHNLDVEVKQR